MRHAEPLLPDRSKRFVGRSDPPLSAAGFEQARRLAGRLRHVRFDAVYSSDLRRALVTAEIIAEAQTGGGEAPRVVRDPRLREIDAGLWEWLTFEEAAARYPQAHAEREGDLIGYRFPGGESYRDLRERVLPAFWEIAALGGADVLIIGHLGVNRVVLCECLGLPLEEAFSIRQDYACVNVVRVEGPAGGAPWIAVLAVNAEGPDAGGLSARR